MNSSPNALTRFLILALGFEAGLGGVALVVGWLLGHWPLVGIGEPEGAGIATAWALGLGVAASLPMLGGLLLVDHLPLKSARRLRRVVDHRVVPLFQGLSVLSFAALSMAAGFGEEVLFRGLLQAGLAQALGGTLGICVGILVASLLFGLVHWVSRDYALLAFAVSVYLGLLLVVTQNVLTPIMAHACYDFAALIYLTAHKKSRQSPPSMDGGDTGNHQTR